MLHAKCCAIRCSISGEEHILVFPYIHVYHYVKLKAPGDPMNFMYTNFNLLDPRMFHTKYKKILILPLTGPQKKASPFREISLVVLEEVV